MRSVIKVLVALAIVGSVTVLEAQPNNASVNVEATVATPLTLTVSSPSLNLGTVFPGTDPAAVPAASGVTFSASGQASANVNFRYTSLPMQLTSGVNSIPVSSWPQCVSNDGGATCSGATSAAAATNYPVALSGAGAAQVQLGVDLDAVPAVQAAGTYQATVTLEVNYTGS